MGDIQGIPICGDPWFPWHACNLTESEGPWTEPFAFTEKSEVRASGLSDVGWVYKDTQRSGPY